MESPPLEVAFRALGDPIRREIIERLAVGDATVNQLATPFAVSLQAVSRHIQLLEHAGLVSRRRVGQMRPVHLELAPIDRMARWMDANRRRVHARYDRLDDVIVDLQKGW